MFPRRREPELMDDPALDPAEHRRALAGLARLNRYGGSARHLWPPLRRLAATLGRTVRVLDVATGSGDVPLALARRASRAGLPFEFAGCDVSPTAVDAAPAGQGVAFFVHDVLKKPLPDGYDAVTCSLFLHHLAEAEAVGLLREMARAAGRLVVVSDLARGRVNLGLVRVACTIFTSSPVVRFDGPVSVRAAFTPAELRKLAADAGLAGAKVSARLPCRQLLVWEKPA